MISFLSFILAMFATMVMIPPLVIAAKYLGFVDMPNARKVHKNAIPRIGGLAFYLGAMLPIIMWADLSNEVISYLIGGLIIVVFGLIDDRLELGFKVKLIGQVAGCAVVIFFGGVLVEDMPSFMGGEGLSLLVSVPLTLFLVVSVTNAVNFSDGLDGLAGGIVVVSLLVIGLLAFEREIFPIALICVALVGAILGFLQYNSHPATLFMGDSGSQFLGFTIAVLAIWLTQGEFGAYATSLPLLLVGLPLIDIVMVTINRKLAGKSPFEPDKTHFHHRMLSLGLDHLEAVMVVYLFQVVLVVGGYFLRFSSDAYIIIIFSGILLMYLIIFRNTELLKEWFRPKVFGLGGSPFARKINYLRKEGGFSRASCFISTIAIAAFYIYALSVCSPPRFGIGVFALGLFATVLGIRLYFKNSFTELFERIVFYGVACTMVFLIEPSFTDSHSLLVFFAALATVVFVGMHYTGDVRANVRPLDVLVLLIVLLIPQVFSTLGLDERHAFSAFYLATMFYAIELLLLTSTFYCGQQKYIKLGLIVPLFILGGMGVFSI